MSADVAAEGTTVRGMLQGSRIVYELEDRVTSVGRSSTCDIILDRSKSISGSHAELIIEEDGSATLVDLNSLNGCFVNEVRVQAAECPLQQGDVIRFGYDEESFRFWLPNTVVPNPSLGVAAAPTPEDAALSEWQSRRRRSIDVLAAGKTTSEYIEYVPSQHEPAYPIAAAKHHSALDPAALPAAGLRGSLAQPPASPRRSGRRSLSTDRSARLRDMRGGGVASSLFGGPWSRPEEGATIGGAAVAVNAPQARGQQPQPPQQQQQQQSRVAPSAARRLAEADTPPPPQLPRTQQQQQQRRSAPTPPQPTTFSSRSSDASQPAVKPWRGRPSVAFVVPLAAAQVSYSGPVDDDDEPAAKVVAASSESELVSVLTGVHSRPTAAAAASASSRPTDASTSRVPTVWPQRQNPSNPKPLPQQQPFRYEEEEEEQEHVLQRPELQSDSSSPATAAAASVDPNQAVSQWLEEGGASYILSQNPPSRIVAARNSGASSSNRVNGATNSDEFDLQQQQQRHYEASSSSSEREDGDHQDHTQQRTHRGNRLPTHATSNAAPDYSADSRTSASASSALRTASVAPPASNIIVRDGGDDSGGPSNFEPTSGSMHGFNEGHQALLEQLAGIVSTMQQQNQQQLQPQSLPPDQQRQQNQPQQPLFYDSHDSAYDDDDAPPVALDGPGTRNQRNMLASLNNASRTPADTVASTAAVRAPLNVMRSPTAAAAAMPLHSSPGLLSNPMLNSTTTDDDDARAGPSRRRVQQAAEGHHVANVDFAVSAQRQDPRAANSSPRRLSQLGPRAAQLALSAMAGTREEQVRRLISSADNEIIRLAAAAGAAFADDAVLEPAVAANHSANASQRQNQQQQQQQRGQQRKRDSTPAVSNNASNLEERDDDTSDGSESPPVPVPAPSPTTSDRRAPDSRTSQRPSAAGDGDATASADTAAADHRDTSAPASARPPRDSPRERKQTDTPEQQQQQQRLIPSGDNTHAAPYDSPAVSRAPANGPSSEPSTQRSGGAGGFSENIDRTGISTTDPLAMFPLRSSPARSGTQYAGTDEVDVGDRGLFPLHGGAGAALSGSVVALSRVSPLGNLPLLSATRCARLPGSSPILTSRSSGGLGYSGRAGGGSGFW